MDAIIRRRVQEALAAHPQGATVSEVARTANLPRYRVVTALEALQAEGLAGRVEVQAATGFPGAGRKVQGWQPTGKAGKATARPARRLRGGLEGTGAG
jgi:predicted ArsR family transcriptional regulator